MLGFISKKLLHLQHLNGYKAFVLHHQSTNFNAFLFSTALKSSASVQYDSKGDAFTVSYLVSSCGIADDAANTISKKLQLKSAEKPSRTLDFLRSYGFTDPQISTIVTVSPFVLHSDPVKTLKPKFDLFASLGASNESLLKIIRYCPSIFRMNVQKTLVPVLDIFKNIVASNEELITLFTRFGILRTTSTTLGANVAYLRDVGMPRSFISRFLMLNGNSITLKPVKFKMMVDRALAMGFKVEKTNFGGAINSFTALTEEKLEQKVEIFQKWGWSETEFNVAFMKQPRIMILSDANIEGTMDYLVDKMGVDVASLARNPQILLSSLNNRIIPRCSVVRVLLCKGLIKKNYNLDSLIRSTDEYFLKVFVEKHAGVRSELLALYHSLTVKH